MWACECRGSTWHNPDNRNLGRHFGLHRNLLITSSGSSGATTDEAQLKDPPLYYPTKPQCLSTASAYFTCSPATFPIPFYDVWYSITSLRLLITSSPSPVFPSHCSHSISHAAHSTGTPLPSPAGIDLISNAQLPRRTRLVTCYNLLTPLDNPLQQLRTSG